MEKLFLTVETVAAIVLIAVILNAMSRRARIVAGLAIVLIVAVLALTLRLAAGRDLGQWLTTDQQTRHWFETLMQPDNPGISCCGEADAYWADSYEVSKDGEYIAIITDERPDAPLKREHVAVGTKILIPKYKLKFDQSNPTGHGIVFLGRANYVFCYVAPGGV